MQVLQSSQGGSLHLQKWKIEQGGRRAKVGDGSCGLENDVSAKGRSYQEIGKTAVRGDQVRARILKELYVNGAVQITVIEGEAKPTLHGERQKDEVRRRSI